MQIHRSIRLLLLAFLILAIPVASFAGVFVSINIAPPALPVYVQPPCPVDGYLWTPGYWAYGDDGYYWVPGTWIEPPQVGFLWTPGYWGWGEGVYAWHGGYWGEHIGFYGGVNYGFGYGGVGYEGGFWQGGRFSYNRSVTNVNVTIVHNVYNKTVIVNNNTHVSFNGPGGVTRQASPDEERFSHEQHVQATAMQTQHEHAAASNPQLRASVNHGKPAIAATAKPGEFSGRGVVAAKQAGAPYKPSAASPRANNVPRPGNKTENNPARPAAAAHNNVPRPPNASNRTSTAHTDNAARPEHAAAEHNVPRPDRSIHTQPMQREKPVHQAAAPRPEHTAAPRESKPQAEKAPAPHHESAPRPPKEEEKHK
ncbi:MAG: hypothetical protein WB421_00920 [Terriglobales bacterium]|jgi:hypothetical protein